MKRPKFEKYLDVIFRDITTFGSFAFHFFLILFVLALGHFFLVWQLLFAFFFTLLVTVIIRQFYFKDRPLKQAHGNFVEKIDAASFPSLHTARIVAIVLLLLDFIQNNTVTAFLLGFSILVIYSRVYLKKHDWEDVAGGMILGVVTFFLALLV
ncbi:phosphatase PAP2 family protein [Candidatus Woesearchaeota archaeon]|nr:phosphatase PAP2 family protein [Candidatus Woesearchaeota archaeon]